MNMKNTILGRLLINLFKTAQLNRTVHVQIKLLVDNTETKSIDMLFYTQDDAITFCKYQTQMCKNAVVSLRCKEWDYEMHFRSDDFEYLLAK